MSCCTPLRRCRLACARGVNRTSDGIAASCSPLSSAHWIPRRLRAPALGADHTLQRAGASRALRGRVARVESEMRDDLRDLARLDTVVEREIHVVRHLGRLVARDEGRERHDAAVAWRKTGPPPYLA